MANPTSGLTPDDTCPVSDLTVRGCHHCRQTGAYVPDKKSDKATLNLDDIGVGQISMDAMGSVYLSPGVYDGEFVPADEGLQRGKFGRGRHLH